VEPPTQVLPQAQQDLRWSSKVFTPSGHGGCDTAIRSALIFGCVSDQLLISTDSDQRHMRCAVFSHGRHEFVLMNQGKRHTKNCQEAPYTCDLLGSMPEISAAAIGDVKFSLMQPGTIVRPHTGPTNKRIRLHLGLDVPSPL
jgi:aspartyl/asparaginyl beta-hydroxylase (cupin superfamily)